MELTPQVSQAQNAHAQSGFSFGGVGGNALRGLLRLVIKRPGWALGALLLALSLSFGYLMRTPASYQATTTLEIFRDSNRESTSTDINDKAPVFLDQEYYETQFGLLRGPSIARDVVRRLRLTQNSKFMGDDQPKDLTAEDLRKREAVAIRKVQDNLQVVPTRLSRLVDLRYVDNDPVLAAQIANAFADIYISSNLARRIQRTDYARQFLGEQIADVRIKLEDQERRLIDYAAKAQIISLGAQRGEGKDSGASQTAGQSLAGTELLALSGELARARAARAEAHGRLVSVRSGGGLNRPEILQNNAVNSLYQRRAELRAEAARLATQFEDEYPPLVAVRSQADQIQLQLSSLTEQIDLSIASEYNAATDREKAIEAKVNSLKDELVSLSRRSIQYNILQRDVDTSRAQYDALLQRLKQVSVANDVGSSNVSVILKADPPFKKYAPVASRILLIGLMSGILLAIATVLILELFDASVSSPEDVQERFDLPLIGVIPSVGSSDPLEGISDIKSGLSEAYLSAHANLRYASGKGAPHVLGISSTQSSEGKSTSSIALAALFARQGETVVLVDCDMRKPSLHRRLGLANTRGLSDLLSGEDQIDSVSQQAGDIVSGLTFIAAGPHPPSPAELLSDPRLAETIAKLRDKYDRVVLDCPPVLGLADAPLIGSQADGMLFVVESGRTRTGAVRRSIDRLRNLQANVVGVLFTKFVVRNSMFSEYGYGSYDYYGYGSKVKDKQ